MFPLCPYQQWKCTEWILRTQTLVKKTTLQITEVYLCTVNTKCSRLTLPFSIVFIHRWQMLKKEKEKPSKACWWGVVCSDKETTVFHLKWSKEHIKCQLSTRTLMLRFTSGRELQFNRKRTDARVKLKGTRERTDPSFKWTSLVPLLLKQSQVVMCAE